jgi:Pentapeptide repeats (8 copies)
MLREAQFVESDLSGANFTKADLTGANLNDATLAGTILYATLLHKADLTGAFLRWADLSRAIATHANFTGADLRRTHLARTNFEGANLTSVKVYGTSAWDLNLRDAVQLDIVITDEDRPEITVDNIEVAQFIYLLLSNERIRQIIDTIGKKAVLILGRFTAARKAVLDAIRQELRKLDYIPILFDFEQPASRDITETVSTLAHMSRFVIADLTAAKSLPQELTRIVPILPSVPVQPILLAREREWSMFDDLRRYPWVLDTVRYRNVSDLMIILREKIIPQAESAARCQTPASTVPFSAARPRSNNS